MSAVANRRPSLTPSSPASRRGSCIDLPVISAPTSRRGSRVDLSINTSLANNQNEHHAGPSSQAKLAINQLLSNLSHVSESQDKMSSPKSTRSTPTSDTQGVKRKFDVDEDSTANKVANATEIQLPSDPLRRASIINLATAAAAAVLQSQVGQRRMSAHPEQDQKRQRVEQLGMLIEQARKASVGTLSLDITRHVESASKNVAIATALANHLGLTPQASAASTPSAGTPAPSSPTKMPAAALVAPKTPTTPKSSLASGTLTASQVVEHQSAGQDAAESSAEAIKREERFAEKPLLPASPTSPTSTPAITLNKSEPLSSSSSAGILDEAKEAAHTYSRFYRFEKEWAQKALELERRRSSVRIDPLFNPNPTLSPLAADASVSDDKSRLPASPKQHSAPESRVMSRGTSPFGDLSAGPSVRTPQSAPSGSFSSAHRGSSNGLANVLSNFAELIEHRQRSCSGLEALAKQAKELPVKRLSQPNPHFRTTFGEFSWNKKPTGPSRQSTSHTINEGDADSDASSVYSEAPSVSKASSSRATLLHAKSERKLKDGAEEDEAPATPRSTMSIASML